MVYFDDILIYSLTIENHKEHVRQVLETLRKEKLYANAEKCVFAIDHIDFLGFVVSSKRVHVDEKKVATIGLHPPILVRYGAFMDSLVSIEDLLKILVPLLHLSMR